MEGGESTHSAVVITRHGKSAAVLVSPDDLESLTETLHWLSDPSHRSEISEADTDIEAGRTLSLAELGGMRSGFVGVANRVLVRIDEDIRVVHVMRIVHRADVYRL